MVNCGYCGHPGIHAEVMPPRGGRTRCKSCEVCRREIAEEQAAQAEKEGK